MKKEKQKMLLFRFTEYMGSKKILIPIAFVLSGLSAIFQIIPFILVWQIVKSMLGYDGGLIDDESIQYYAIIAFIMAILSQVVYFLALMSSHLAAFRVEVGLQKVVMRKIMDMPLGFFDVHSSGKIRKVVNEGASSTHTFLAHQLPDLAGAIVSPILVLVLLFVFDWRMGLFTLVPLMLGMVIMGFMMNSIGEEFQKKYFDSLEEMSSEAVEYVRGIPVVKTFGQSIFSFKKFYNAIIFYRDMVYSYTKLWKTPMSIFTTIVQSSVLFVLPMFVFIVVSGGNFKLAIADFVFYIIIIPVFSSLVMKIMHFQNDVSIAKQAIDRIDDMLNYQKMDFKEDACHIESDDLVFQDVTFSYPEANNPAIKNINLTIGKGQKVALVGASGSGKTTLARLGARFWDVESGTIRIGGIDIKEIPKKQLMDSISFVFQNTKLMKGTLRENIVFGKEHITEDDINRALKVANAKDIVDKLSNGLDTVMGTEGTYLSGGEQQRIALARAILKDSPIVLLDEATAFADPENQHLIHEALEEISKGKTTLMIAHRLDTIKNVDKIVVLDKGEIVEVGKHQELMNKNGVYNKMWSEYQESLEWKVESNFNESEVQNG